MRKLLPLLVVSILVLGGLGTVAIPIEKPTEAKPLNIQDSPINITVKGGLLGYKVTVTNVGNEAVNGTLNMTITTDATFMIMGDVLSHDSFELDLETSENLKFKWGPVIGFGPAKITASCSLQYGDGPWEINYSGNTTGFVLLFYVSCRMELDPETGGPLTP